MSVKVTALVWDHYPNGGGERLTALALADAAEHDGSSIYPGIRRISKMTMQSERTVQRHIQTMLDNGWLLKTQDGGLGRGSYTAYRMPIEAIPLGAVGRVTKLHPKSYPQGCHPKQDRVTNGANKGDIGDTTYTHGLPVLKPGVDKKKSRTPKPLHQQTDGELIAKALALGINTRGLKREDLVRAITARIQ